MAFAMILRPFDRTRMPPGTFYGRTTKRDISGLKLSCEAQDGRELDAGGELRNRTIGQATTPGIAIRTSTVVATNLTMSPKRVEKLMMLSQEFTIHITRVLCGK
jgi:hypothetical protein